VLASLGTAAAVGVVGAVGLSSLAGTSRVAREAVTQQLALIDDAAAMSAFQYQKGFVAEYLLTGNRAWLSELETSRPAFESWLAAAHAKVASPALGRLLDDIQREYTAYDGARKTAVALHDAGRIEEAKAALEGNHARVQRLWELFRQFGGIARRDAEATLADAEQHVRRLGKVLVATSVAGALASLLVGFLWARRITQADAAIDEHRRRLVQSEKLSAVGELAAKLAHEVLNPLAGMKAAIQLLARQGTLSGQGASAPGGSAVVDTAEALNREIARVEGLVRRLVNYSRPLAPRVEVATVGSLFDAALEAAAPVFGRRGVTVSRREAPDLPPIEVDPLLFAQVLVNLLTNAAEAAGPGGGRVELAAARISNGHDELCIQVADDGPGLSSAQLPELFKPFFTTKPEGHGLGLAVSQNIVVEHGGRIAARNRPPAEGHGAVFEIRLPVIR
jgi:signal transduction histidine kinase